MHTEAQPQPESARRRALTTHERQAMAEVLRALATALVRGSVELNEEAVGVDDFDLEVLEDVCRLESDVAQSYAGADVETADGWRSRRDALHTLTGLRSEFAEQITETFGARLEQLLEESGRDLEAERAAALNASVERTIQAQRALVQG
jgi:hypothetical protein